MEQLENRSQTNKSQYSPTKIPTIRWSRQIYASKIACWAIIKIEILAAPCKQYINNSSKWACKPCNAGGFLLLNVSQREGIFTDCVLLCSICLISSKTWRKEIYHTLVKKFTDWTSGQINKDNIDIKIKIKTARGYKSDHQCVVDCFVVINFNIQRSCIQ